MLKLAYFGTPDFSARLLERIINDKDLPVEVVFVVTRPDKPVGRKQTMTKSAVKLAAEKYNIKIIDSISNFKPASRGEFQIVNLDLALLYAYGQIIPQSLLEQPRLGFWNIHPSLLPKYRGPSPVAYPLINGEAKTGVTLMQMDEELDHGPIIAREALEIKPDERRPELTDRLTDLGFELFKNIINKPISTDFNRFQPIQQEHANATYTKILKKDDGFIPLSTLQKALKGDSALKYYNLFRGLYDWPGIWTKIKIDNVEKRLKIIEMDFVGANLDSPAAIKINRVQLEGKKEVSFRQFNEAYKIFGS